MVWEETDWAFGGNVTLYSYENSTAVAQAQKKGYDFVPIQEFPIYVPQSILLKYTVMIDDVEVETEGGYLKTVANEAKSTRGKDCHLPE